MMRNYPTCPRCGGEWVGSFDKTQICDRCGLSKTPYDSLRGEGYCIDVGSYALYWTYWDQHKDEFYIERLVDGVGQGMIQMEPLPFDVSEDALKLYMVFS